ncbi:HNH endonuclease [Paraglaciecola chathamensis]|jgi:hypothetical protein|uniref:HNH endonuclease 5 domain-containing protein n=1 Tax=Paraglaciecola chathamensis TaxID=368405 RepID=A0A8H9IGF1_9ALTE|nr:HNH endonuclease [Paraglaciecola oceanifecundans]GGZ84068.1 hypothetical protein GCM10011274_46930 [Paraglaciecola oceanifecundans]
MSLPECVLCDVKISKDNDTREHLIPNAIGGRKKVRGFICNDCNNQSGDDWESELAKQLNPLSLFFGISRERGNVPSQMFQTTGGEQLKLNAEGSMDIPKPEYTETPIESGVQININARSMSEAKQMLKGVQRKYPQANLDDLLSNAQEKSSYCPDMLKFNLSFGGQNPGRSIVKSALALAVEAGINTKSCEHAQDYLRNEESEACFGYYYEHDLLLNRPEGIPLHCISIKAFPDTKQLLGYVEFFGVQRMIICLSSSYEGPEITSTYAINPITGEELNITTDLALSESDIKASYNYEKIPAGSVEAAFSKVIPVGMAASVEKEKNRVLDKAIQHAFANCGAKEGELLLPEHVDKLTGLVMEKLEPFILHQFSSKRRR